MFYDNIFLVFYENNDFRIQRDFFLRKFNYFGVQQITRGAFAISIKKDEEINSRRFNPKVYSFYSFDIFYHYPFLFFFARNPNCSTTANNKRGRKLIRAAWGKSQNKQLLKKHTIVSKGIQIMIK